MFWDFRNGDLIYYEDESGKKDNVGLFLEENETTCSIYINNDTTLDIDKDKIQPIRIDDKIMSGISDLEKIDRWHYKCSGDYADFIFVIELADGHPWYFLEVYLYNEKYIKTPEYYSDKMLKGCLHITDIYYLHELRQLEDILNLCITTYEVNGKVTGIDSCKDANRKLHLLECTLTDRSKVEEFKEKLKNEKTESKENI